MKILAGKFGSRKIDTSQKLSYRPTKSLVRKSIFDILEPFNYNSVLDLFSGSGIFGFESASRGAQSVTFVENNLKAFKLLQKNAELLSGPDYKFYFKSVFNFLNSKTKYDLIFADPPYDKFDLVVLAETILEHLDKKGKFILECELKQIPFMGSQYRDYGQTRILFWENI